MKKIFLFFIFVAWSVNQNSRADQLLFSQPSGVTDIDNHSCLNLQETPPANKMWICHNLPSPGGALQGASSPFLGNLTGFFPRNRLASQRVTNEQHPANLLQMEDGTVGIYLHSASLPSTGDWSRYTLNVSSANYVFSLKDAPQPWDELKAQSGVVFNVDLKIKTAKAINAPVSEPSEPFYSWPRSAVYLYLALVLYDEVNNKAFWLTLFLYDHRGSLADSIHWDDWAFGTGIPVVDSFLDFKKRDFSTARQSPAIVGTENYQNIKVGVSTFDLENALKRLNRLYHFGITENVRNIKILSAHLNGELFRGALKQSDPPAELGFSFKNLSLSQVSDVSDSSVANCTGSNQRPDDCYHEGISPRYTQDMSVGNERKGPSNATLVLQYANGNNGFKVWKEKNGNRILNATGLSAKGWQQSLNRSGTAFSGFDFSSPHLVGQIAGRACPSHVFLSRWNMAAGDRCLYFDSGNNAQRLDARPALVEGVDWLRSWKRAVTGRGTQSSYFEGNIKTCADKGMRLPTLYETAARRPASSLPMGEVVGPAFSEFTGVPSVSGSPTWTASAFTKDLNQFWGWSGNQSSNASSGISRAIRCVLP